jgi:hypothetical protein
VPKKSSYIEKKNQKKSLQLDARMAGKLRTLSNIAKDAEKKASFGTLEVAYSSPSK